MIAVCCGRQRDRVVDLRDGRRGHARHHLLGLEADDRRRAVLCRGAAHHRNPERLRDRRRLHVGGLVPGHRRIDLPVRLRRLRLLGRMARRVPDRAVPALRAHAELRQVHDGRRAHVPHEPATGQDRGSNRHALRGGLLPDRPDDRGRRADPGARWDRLQPRGHHHRLLHAHLRACSAACSRRRGCRSSRPAC